MESIISQRSQLLVCFRASSWLLFAALFLAACDDSDPYRRGFGAGVADGRREGYQLGFDAGNRSGLEAGKKNGKEIGFIQGRLLGYAEGSVEILGRHWRLSLGLGLCIGLAGIAAWGVCLVLRKPVRLAADAVVISTIALRDRCLAVSLARRTEWRLERLCAEDKAITDCQARVLMAGALREVKQQLGSEQLQLAVETFIRESVTLREMDAQVDVMIRAATDARELIQSHPDLNATARLALLRKLVEKMFPSVAATAAQANAFPALASRES